MRKLKTILLFSLLLIIFSPAIALAQSGTLDLPADGFKYLCNDLSQYKDNESFCTSKGQRVPTTAEINATVLPCGSSANKCGGNQVPVCCYGGLITNQTVPPKKPLFVMPVPEVTIPTVKLTEATCELNPQTNTYVCAVPWIGEYINGIYKYGINIAGILAALVLMGGGLLWLISGGDASKITKAKEMIIGSVTGLIILMSSYLILTQINPDLVKMKSIGVGVISKIEAGNEVSEGATSALFQCLYKEYGQSATEVEKKLTTVNFLGHSYRVNTGTANALSTAQQIIDKSNITYKSTSGSGFNWRPNVNKPTEQSLHSFGIAIDINPSKNPNSVTTNKPCQTDIPQELINILKNNGFRWGGDYTTVCDAMHFEWVGGDAPCKIN